MTEKMPAHRILGISDKREAEIAKEVITTLKESRFVYEGIKKLMQKYDAETLLVGMQLMQAIRMNNEAGDRISMNNDTSDRTIETTGIERQKALQNAARN